MANAQEREVEVYEFGATHYGTSYNGQGLGCSRYGTYSSSDWTIVAVSPTFDRMWPCGTQLLIEGPAGTIQAVRKDSCPGCDPTSAHGRLIDLSEEGITRVCGGLGGCKVMVSEIVN